MKKEYFKNIKRIILIILLLSAPLWNSCKEEKEEPPPPPVYCGVGTGDFSFNIVGSIPTTFDCNTSGSFVIDLQPDIDNSFIGFNRLDFKLVKGGHTYRSNYVEFESENTATQQLEWGGSLPSGTYEMRGILKNIQLTSTCEDSVYRIENKHLGNIVITEFSDPEKVMVIEYFCQTSYNVFSSPHTSEYMDIAFNIANTRDNVITYQTNLEPEVIEYDPYDPREIKNYIFNLKQWEDEMFLCGIKAFKDTAGYLLPNLFGATYEDDTLGFVPTCSTGSLVAVKTCIDFAASDQYKLDYNDLVTATVIHELGHQRGVWQEHGLQDPKFCVMKRVFIVYYYEAEHPYWAVTYSNPHFCDDCITKIKNITW